MLEFAQRVFENSISHPSKIALVHDSKSLTYQDLWRQASAVASHLSILPGEVVLQYVERGFDMITGILAISIAGGVYCPYHPNDPIERLTTIQQITSSSVIMTTSNYKSNLAHLPFRSFIYLDTIIPEKELQVLSCSLPYKEGLNFDDEEFTMCLHSSTSSNPIIYLISTSGTTGVPKLVAITQDSLNNLTKGLIETLQWNKTDRILQLARCSFDAQIPEIYTALTIGSTVICISAQWTYNMGYLIDTIQKQQVSVLFMVPSLIPSLVKSATRKNVFFSSIRSLITGGEAMIRSVVNELTQIVSSRSITIAYGPTECTVFSTFFSLDNQTDDYPNFPLGSPLPGYVCGIFNDQHERMSLHEMGEIYISGEGLMKGYYQNKEGSDNAFVVINHQTWYKTGDLGKEIKENVFYHEGRKDFQIKLNGQRLELDEIEHVLRTHHSEISNVVIMKRKTGNAEELVAYIENPSKQVSDYAEYVDYKTTCINKLSSYMVPRHFVEMKQFPLTVNGKVDRKSLPEPELSL